MQFNPNIHHRQSTRLRGYDYSQPGAYFITVCTHQRQPLFGHIADGMMVLNAACEMVESVWRELVNKFPVIRLHEFVTMPYHYHLGVLRVIRKKASAVMAVPM